MKKLIALSIFLLSFHTSVSAMMLAPLIQEERAVAKHQRAQEKIYREHLRAQEKIDKIVCLTAQDVYAKINRNWAYPPAHTEIHIESPYWEAKYIKTTALISGEKIESYCPTLILKTSPDQIIEAMDDLINKPALLECTTARNTAQIFCMKNIMGPFYFKKYAVNFYKLLDSTDGWSTDQFFHELPEQFLKKVNGKERPGSIAYITNVAIYRKLKPSGNGCGSNVFCVGDNQYIGFSGIYKNGPQPLKVIEAQDFKLLCDTHDLKKKHVAQHSDFCKSLTKERFEQLRRKEQEDHCNFHWIFDAEKFKDFKKTGRIVL